MPTVPVADATLYYREQGAGDPMVLAHGLTSVGERWADLAAALADRYRVLVPDLRGHGRSTGPPETIGFDRFAADLVALLDHLGLERAHFVGHSAGALALLALGLRSPGRARTLTLGGMAHVWDAPVRARLRQAADAWPTQPGWIDEQRGRHGATHGPDHWRVLVATLRAWADDPAMPPYQPADLAAVTCPTLVVHGDRDQAYPVEAATALYRALPNAELAVLPGATHGAHRERPDLFLHIVADFLARHADA
jgi:pimeloyl-ACP methyl ester carboxylesterase